MQDFDTEITTGNACPICQSALENGDLFCARCGTFLRGDNSSPEALNLPVIHLLTQVCSLQKDLLRQYRTGQALQARQFQHALKLQADQLEKTLDHAARQSESQERRLQLLVRWIAGLAAAGVAILFIAVQLA